MRVRISVITVTYNSTDALTRFGTPQRSDDTEWIVVDNGSTDDSAGLAETLGARVIRMGENLGFSAANNVGLSHARGDFIGFVNPDVHIDVDTLARLEQTARQREAIVAPQLVNPDGSLQPNGRGFPLLTAKIKNRLKGGDDRYLLYASGDEPRAVCWLMGAAVFASREVLERFGAWDPYFFLYYEDKDICLRAWHAGVPVLVDPAVRWTHGWARETKSLNLVAWRHELASMTKFYRRYPEFLLGATASRRAHPLIDSSVFGSAAR